MTKLNLYVDSNNEEHVAIMDDELVEQRYIEDGLTLIESVELVGNFGSWPTNRLLIPV